MTSAHMAGTSPLLDLLFEDPGAGRCLVAPDGSVLRANAEWLRSTGYALEDVLGEDVLSLFPESRDVALALHARVRAGHHVEVPRHAQRADGREAWWDGCIDPVPMAGGTGLLITARRVAQDGGPRAAPSPPGQPAVAVEVLARLREIADHAPAAVFVKDADGRYLFVNRWSREHFGLGRGEVLGRTAAEVMPEPAARRTEEHERRVAAGEEVASEETIPTPGGDRVFMVVRIPFPLGGTTRGTVGIAVDVTDVRRAEEALRESEERFRLLAQAMPQIVCVLGPDGWPEYLNPSWTAFSGLDLDAARSAGWEGALHPEDVAAARETLRRALSLRAPQDVELRYRAADGTFRWFLSRLVPVVEQGRVVRLVGAGMEIEHRRRAEEALREQLAVQDQLAKVAESVPGVVCSFRRLPDGSARMTFSAPAIVDLYGFSREELARDMGPAFARVVPEDLARVNEEIALSERTLTRWRARFRYDHPHKGLRWIEGTSIPVREADGCVLWHGYVADVTEQVRAEEALRDSVARFSTLADNIAQLAWMADETGSRFWVNQRWFQYTGITLEEVQGFGWRAAQHPDHADRVVEKLRRCFASGEPWEDTYPLRGRDGTYRWFLSRSVPIRDERGAVTRWFGTATDVTEQLDAQEALRDADRRKNEFLGMLSHELRNPLAPIRNALYVLDRVDPSGQEARRAKAVANRQIEHLTRLVDDLLDVTRIARGKIELRREDLDLVALVRRTADDYGELMHGRGLDLALDLPGDPVIVNGDETRLAQVLGNLLSNAAKFTPAGGNVTIAVATEARSAVVRVRDTGVGIEPSSLRSMFDPFVQGKQTLARTEGGLGLGLALVDGLVGLHGGTVSAASAGPLSGAELVIRLPLAAAGGARAPARGAEGAHASAKPLRVLVVDDNRDAAETLAHVVELLGHDADTAFDGPSAVAKVRASPPDVVLCDLGLPGMDGYAVARELRAAFGDRVRLVAVSGYAQPEDVQRAAEAGFDQHVAKPAELSKIERALSG